MVILERRPCKERDSGYLVNANIMATNDGEQIEIIVRAAEHACNEATYGKGHRCSRERSVQLFCGRLKMDGVLSVAVSREGVVETAGIEDSRLGREAFSSPCPAGASPL
jgi:hypothetical protein